MLKQVDQFLRMAPKTTTTILRLAFCSIAVLLWLITVAIVAANDMVDVGFLSGFVALNITFRLWAKAIRDEASCNFQKPNA